MRRFARRPSAAMVVACGALLLSLTGTGLADVAKLAKNSVGSPQLRTGAVTTPKVHNAAITTAKLHNGSVTLTKLAANARIPGPHGPAGPPGPPGPPGAPANLADGSITTAKLADGAATSAKLAANAATASKLPTYIKTTSFNIGGANYGGASVPCGANEKIVSGGAWWTPGMSNAQAKNLHILQSFPSDLGRWSAFGYNGTGAVRTLTVQLLCLKNT